MASGDYEFMCPQVTVGDVVGLGDVPEIVAEAFVTPDLGDVYWAVKTREVSAFHGTWMRVFVDRESAEAAGMASCRQTFWVGQVTLAEALSWLRRDNCYLNRRRPGLRVMALDADGWVTVLEVPYAGA